VNFFKTLAIIVLPVFTINLYAYPFSGNLLKGSTTIPIEGEIHCNDYGKSFSANYSYKKYGKKIKLEGEKLNNETVFLTEKQGNKNTGFFILQWSDKKLGGYWFNLDNRYIADITPEYSPWISGDVENVKDMGYRTYVLATGTNSGEVYVEIDGLPKVKITNINRCMRDNYVDHVWVKKLKENTYEIEWRVGGTYSAHEDYMCDMVVNKNGYPVKPVDEGCENT